MGRKIWKREKFALSALLRLESRRITFEYCATFGVFCAFAATFAVEVYVLVLVSY